MEKTSAVVTVCGLWIYVIPPGVDLGNLRQVPKSDWEYLNFLPGNWNAADAGKYLERNFPNSENIIALIVGQGTSGTIVTRKE